MLKIIAIIIAIFFVYFIFINWGDEELKPEVKQALAWQPPTNAFDDNGYLVLWGIEAPIEMDAAQIGKKQQETELARFAAMQKTHKDPSPFQPNLAEIDEYIDWKDIQCDYQKQQNCVDFYLQQGTDKLAFVLLSQERLAARFDDIKQSKNYVEVVPPMIAAGLPKYHLLMQASELERIRAINDIAENRMGIGLQGIVNNALFSRKLLRDSNSLISHMIAVAMMQRDTRVLGELMVKYPKIATQHAAQLAPVLAPISTPEYSLKKAIIYERDLGFQMMNSLKFTTPSEFSGANANRFLKLYNWLGFQGNATNNALYEQSKLFVKLAEVNAAELDDVKAEIVKKQFDDFEIDYRLFTTKNPAGRILIEVAQPDYTGYVERQHDLDGYIYMVNFQLTAILNKLEIKQLGLHDPYKKLMQYDADSGVLSFAGRQPSTTNFNKSNIYQVKMQ
jgi:hypothetical protein